MLYVSGPVRYTQRIMLLKVYHFRKINQEGKISFLLLVPGMRECSPEKDQLWNKINLSNEWG